MSTYLFPICYCDSDWFALKYVIHLQKQEMSYEKLKDEVSYWWRTQWAIIIYISWGYNPKSSIIFWDASLFPPFCEWKGEIKDKGEKQKKKQCVISNKLTELRVSVSPQIHISCVGHKCIKDSEFWDQLIQWNITTKHKRESMHEIGRHLSEVRRLHRHPATADKVYILYAEDLKYKQI